MAFAISYWFYCNALVTPTESLLARLLASSGNDAMRVRSAALCKPNEGHRASRGQTGIEKDIASKRGRRRGLTYMPPCP